MRTFSGSPLRAALLCAALVLLWWTLTVHFNYAGKWTALFCTGDIVPVPAPLKAGTYVFHNSAGYDGQYYRYIAHDPLLRKYRAHIDDVRLRQLRILLPASAYALAAGQENAVDGAYLVVVLLGISAGAYWTAAFAQSQGRSQWWGLAFLLIPGALTSIDRMLVDGQLAALSAAFALAVKAGNRRLLWFALVMAPLTRETGFLLTAAACASELLRKHFRDALVAAATAIPAACWGAYVTSATAPSHASVIAGRPVYGLILRLVEWPGYKGAPAVALAIGAAEAIGVAALILALVLGVYLWWREKRGATEIAGLLFALLGFAFGQSTYLNEAFGYARPPSPLFVFLLFRYLSDGMKIALAPIAGVAIPIGMYFVYQALGIMQWKGLIPASALIRLRRKSPAEWRGPSAAS